MDELTRQRRQGFVMQMAGKCSCMTGIHDIHADLNRHPLMRSFCQ
jgi:hypothetical protein